MFPRKSSILHAKTKSTNASVVLDSKKVGLLSTHNSALLIHLKWWHRLGSSPIVVSDITRMAQPAGKWNVFCKVFTNSSSSTMHCKPSVRGQKGQLATQSGWTRTCTAGSVDVLWVMTICDTMFMMSTSYCLAGRKASRTSASVNGTWVFNLKALFAVKHTTPWLAAHVFSKFKSGVSGALWCCIWSMHAACLLWGRPSTARNPFVWAKAIVWCTL